MAARNAGLRGLLSLSLVAGGVPPAQAAELTIPITRAIALNDRPVTLPADLSTPVTVLIVGFGRQSQDATTAWERPVRLQLARPGTLGFYDMAMLSEVPGLIRPLVLRRIKRVVPDVLKPNFLPLTEDEDAWKRAAGYDSQQPQAAYVLLVDVHGTVRWSTHQAYSTAAWQQLTTAAREVARATN